MNNRAKPWQKLKDFPFLSKQTLLHSTRNRSHNSRFCVELENFEYISIVYIKIIVLGYSRQSSKNGITLKCSIDIQYNLCKDIRCWEKKRITNKRLELFSHLSSNSYRDCVRNTIVSSIRLTFFLVHWTMWPFFCWYIVSLHSHLYINIWILNMNDRIKNIRCKQTSGYERKKKNFATMSLQKLPNHVH